MSPWESAGGSRDTLLGLRPIPCHARRCSVKVGLNQQSLCFLSLSLLSVKRRTSYPVVPEQVEKACEAAAQAQPTKTSSGPRGRPKGSQNRNRREVELSPSLRFIQEHIKRLLQQIGDACKVVYFT